MSEKNNMKKAAKSAAERYLKQDISLRQSCAIEASIHNLQAGAIILYLAGVGARNIDANEGATIVIERDSESRALKVFTDIEDADIYVPYYDGLFGETLRHQLQNRDLNDIDWVLKCPIGGED